MWCQQTISLQMKWNMLLVLGSRPLKLAYSYFEYFFFFHVLRDLHFEEIFLLSPPALLRSTWASKFFAQAVESNLSSANCKEICEKLPEFQPLLCYLQLQSLCVKTSFQHTGTRLLYAIILEHCSKKTEKWKQSKDKATKPVYKEDKSPV